MAYNYNYNSDEGKMSGFNSAAFKMKRLDSILTLINMVNSNLTSFNEQYGVYNYELKFQQCLCLYQEVESKLTKDERKDGEELIQAIQHIIKNNGVHLVKKEKVYPYRIKKVLNTRVWDILEKWLFKLETLVRSYQDAHGMDTSYEEEGLF